MFLYIARRFKDVSEQCPHFELLQGVEIGRWLKSEELIASEFEKYKAVKKWVMSAGDNSCESYLENLMTHVRFELLDRFCINTVLLIWSSTEESEFVIKPMPPFFFTYHHWCMSALVEVLADVGYLVLQFEQ